MSTLAATAKTIEPDMPITAPGAGAGRPQVRIVIVGHVDHGKSTLIGRLLHETGSLPEGKFEALKDMSARRGMPFEWSFLLDALQTERDQGITIDTTQIRFRTAARDVILIDAPGHIEFLRNMITGAAQADAAFLIIDAFEGVRDQTRRHGYLLHLLGIRDVAVVINKMDRIDFDETRFRAIETEIFDHLGGLGLKPVAVIPISARGGDFIAAPSTKMPWYGGGTVLQTLDRLAPAPAAETRALRLPVQDIYKFDDRRILAGRIESGRLKAGDEIVIMPSGKIAKIRSVEGWPHPPQGEEAEAPWPVGITLDRELFVQRGDVIAHPDAAPVETRRIRARVFWLGKQPLTIGASLIVRIGTAEARASVAAIDNAVDPGELSNTGKHVVAQNNVGEIEIALAQPLAVDIHTANPKLGRLVIDMGGRITGGGLILRADAEKRHQVDIVPVESALKAEERIARYRHKGAVVWLTGLPGSGKSTLARALERTLFTRGGAPVLLDGDTLRAGLNSDLGFSKDDRSENIRRIAEIAAHLARSGHVAIVAAVSPIAADRDSARRLAADTGFVEIHVSTPAEICESRDPKGHYQKARAGQIQGFTGTAGDYEAPTAPDLAIDTSVLTTLDAIGRIELKLIGKGVLFDEAADPAALI